MDIKRYFVYEHPVFGIGIVLSVRGNEIDTYFSHKGKTVVSREYISSLPYKKITVKELCLSGALGVFFDSPTRQRSREYINNRIIIKEIDDDHVKANVIGTSVYDTEIKIINNIVSLKCNCPVDGFCKHLYALIETIKIDISFSFPEKYKKYSISQEVDDDTIAKFEELNEEYMSMEVDDLFDLFNGLSKVNINMMDLGIAPFYLNEELYERISQYIPNNNPLYRSISKTHAHLSYGRFYYYQGTSPQTDRGYDLLYMVINQDYQNFKRRFDSYRVNKYEKAIYSYFINQFIYQVHDLYDFYSIFSSNKKQLELTYLRILDKEYKKAFYLQYKSILNSLGIYNDEVNEYDEFLQLKRRIDNGDDLSSTDSKEFMNLAGKISKFSAEVPYFSLLLGFIKESPYGFNSYSTFDKDEIMKMVKELPDNSLLIKLVEDIYG